jgi:hypothetical protein
VVGDDVQIDLEAPRVGGVDEGLQLGLRAEVRIHVGEVGDPVAVIAGGLLTRRPLHDLVPEDRPQPDRRRAQALDVVEPGRQAGQVAAMIETLVRRIEAGLQAIAGETPAIIGQVAVGEPVRQDEIDHLVPGRAIEIGRADDRRGLGQAATHRHRDGERGVRRSTRPCPSNPQAPCPSVLFQDRSMPVGLLVCNNLQKHGKRVNHPSGTLEGQDCRENWP